MSEQNEKYANKPPINLIKAEKHSEDWVMDEKGFFLIDPRPEEGLIYAHHYHANKEYNCSIAGETTEEVYYTILKKELISSLMHAAYLGSELQKAEILVRYNVNIYAQDRPLIFPENFVIKKNHKTRTIQENEDKN